MRNYRNIKAWQLAEDMAVEIYKLSSKFPKSEIFAMSSQIRRAAYSVAANIAEGAGRRTQKDYLRFLDMAKGSLNESDSFLHIAFRLEYISRYEYEYVLKIVIETSKCLTGLMIYIEKKNSSLTTKSVV